MPAVPGLIAALCLLCAAPRVLTDDCSPYVGPDFRLHRGQTCVLSYCVGTCTERYCGVFPLSALDQSQFLCILNNLYVVIGAGLIISLLIIAGVITCFCKSLCLCCNLCFPERRAPRASVSTALVVTNVVPQEPVMVMPSASGYQPVATHYVNYDQRNKGYVPPLYPGADNRAYID